MHNNNNYIQKALRGVISIVQNENSENSMRIFSSYFLSLFSATRSRWFLNILRFANEIKHNLTYNIQGSPFLREGDMFCGGEYIKLCAYCWIVRLDYVRLLIFA